MWGRYCILFCICVSFALKSNAQQYGYAIFFTDKQGSSGSLSSPLSFLSQRSIDRRATQGIAIDSTDLPVSEVYTDSVLKLTGGVVHVFSKWLNVCVIYVFDTTTIASLRGKSFIKDIKWVGYYTTTQHLKLTPTGKLQSEIDNLKWMKTTGTSAYYGNTFAQTTLVNGDYLHDKGYKGQGKLIAVLDAGFLNTDVHPGLDSVMASGRLVDVHNFIDKSDVVYADNEHGFYCLSTMAGNTPGSYVGSAPYASYALYVTEKEPGDQPIEIYSMAAGTERADSIGTDIISISLGYNTFDVIPNSDYVFARDFDGKTTIGAQVANMATKKGILFVASAGNEGNPSTAGWILTPGEADSALTVGNVDSHGYPANNSGSGPNAAGVVKPDVCAMGTDTWLLSGTSSMATSSGTSFATPQIAGWAACLWQAFPHATPYMIRNAINRSADHYSAPGIQLGYGVPNFQAALQILDVKNIGNPYDGNWITVMSNPIKEIINLNANLLTEDRIEFRLYDLSGRLIYHTQETINAGNTNPVTISLAGLPVGIYILHATGNKHNKVIKIVKG